MNNERREIERIILFVTGSAPRSERARANLGKALAAAGVSPGRVEEIDLLERPDATLKYGVYATPALIRVTARDSYCPALYGDLSEEAKLKRFITDVFDEARVPG